MGYTSDIISLSVNGLSGKFMHFYYLWYNSEGLSGILRLSLSVNMDPFMEIDVQSKNERRSMAHLSSIEEDFHTRRQTRFLSLIQIQGP